MTDPATTLDRLVAKSGQLYSLPAVAMEVLELTRNPQVDARALKDCIENDPALTVKILRVVNSALFGLSREVSDLNQALTLLGTKPLKLLVLGFSLPAGLFADVAGEILQRYWRHTLTKAVAGREISERLFNVPGDEAFIAGLLQDLGLLLLIQELGEPYVRFLEKVIAGGKDLSALETESMGFNHTEVSAKLLAHWGLPEMLIEAVASQTTLGPHADASLPEGVLPQILHLAEWFAQLLADEQSAALGELLQAGRQYQDLTKDRLETLVVVLGEKVQQLADVLSLQLPDGLDYADILAQAHSQLAAVAAETAEDLVRTREGEAQQAENASLLGEIQLLAQAVAEAVKRSSSSAPAESLPPKPAVAGPAVAGQGPTDRRPSRAAASTAVATADPGLLGRLEVAVAACRQSRCPLSLLLVQFDEVDELVITRGLDGFGRLRQFLGSLCGTTEHPGSTCVPHGESGFAVVLPNCDRQPAVQLGNQLNDSVRRLTPGSQADTLRVVRLSAGVATVALPPKNFLAENLFTSAERCLYGSHASGGGVVKSIEIY